MNAIGQEIMGLMADELKRRLKDHAKELTAAELEMIRKFLSDNSVTLASVQRGDFGATVQAVADKFYPLPDADDPTYQ